MWDYGQMAVHTAVAVTLVLHAAAKVVLGKLLLPLTVCTAGCQVWCQAWLCHSTNKLVRVQLMSPGLSVV